MARRAIGKRRAIVEQAMRGAFTTCGLLTIVIVFAIAVHLIISGLPAIQEVGLGEFLFGQVWNPFATDADGTADPQFGILPFILTSIVSTLGALLIGVPIGIMASIFLAKVAPPKVAGVVNTAVELLAGIPSVVYGFVGLMVLVPFVRSTFNLAAGATLLAAIVVLSVMILPILTNVSRVALQSVPAEYEEASLALGATKIETIFKISVPAARSGIAAGVVLGVGRAIGEAMAVILVIGNISQMPELLAPARTLTTAIAMEISYATGMQRNALLSIGLVLFVFIFVLNLILNTTLKRGGAK
jgi:phosphate transport system permease protein